MESARELGVQCEFGQLHSVVPVVPHQLRHHFDLFLIDQRDGLADPLQQILKLCFALEQALAIGVELLKQIDPVGANVVRRIFEIAEICQPL